MLQADVYPIAISNPHAHPPRMARTKLFQSNRSQAVRLPKDVAFPEGVSEVRILREGATRVVAPADRVWDDFFDGAGVDLPAREQLERVRG